MAPRAGGTGAGWYYDTADGDVVHQNYVESLANAVPGVGTHYFGPYPTEAAAVQHAGATGPTATPNESLGQQATTVAEQGLLGGKVQEGDLIRIAQVLLGLVLIAVAAARITGASNVVSKAVGAKV